MELREKIAALVHGQWSAWMKHQWATGKWEDGNLTLLAKDVREWCRQAATSYLDLSEEEKESDCKWADKYLALMSVEGKAVEAPKWEVEIASCDVFNSPSFRELNADYFQVYSDGKIIFYNGEQEYGPRVQIAVYAPGQWYGVRKKEWGENEEM